MITGLVDHGLHVILLHPAYIWLINFIFQIYTASAMNFFSHRCIIATTSSSLYRLGHQSALAFFGVKVLRVANYLQTMAFPDLVIVEWEEYPHALQKKATREVTSKVVREMAGRIRPGLTLRMSTSASTIHHTTQ